MIGGYKAIDLKGIELGTTEVLVPGVFSRVESNIDKPFLFQNYKRNGVEKQSFYSTVMTPSGSGYLLSMYATATHIYTLEVMSSDKVRIHPNPLPGAVAAPSDEGPSASL